LAATFIRMYYKYHKRRYSDHILIYVEEYNKSEKTILIDFVDSSEFELFVGLMNIEYDWKGSSMISLNNYNGRTIRENTAYAIPQDIIFEWRTQIVENRKEINSYLIGYNIDCTNTNKDIFSHSVTLTDYAFQKNTFDSSGGGSRFEIPLNFSGKTYVNIRNVGQGNWNEIAFDKKVRIVFDAGAPMNASKNEIKEIIDDRNEIYCETKPLLILSHWDKDHYHSLLGMDDQQIADNFCGFVCRKDPPNKTSKKVFTLLKNALGKNNIYSIPAENRSKRGGPTYFESINNIKDRVVLYNSQYHKNRNISGLALSIKTKNTSVILPGDAHYEQLTRDILIDLNYNHRHHLVVPHHGGQAGKFTYLKHKNIRYSKAVISVGKNNYKHPWKNNIIDLSSNGFDVLKTSKIKSDIKLYLN
jgi:beta-lactamase superfamily II metal-dependent hydrolase